MMAVLLIAVASLLLSGYSLAADNFNRVARTFGRDIFIADLNPTDDELRMLKRSRQDLSDDQIISEVRSEKLGQLIWDPIRAEFDKTHDVKPTEAEIDEIIRAIEAVPLPFPLPDDPKNICQDEKRGRKKDCRVFCQGVEKK